jgi:hypothetical protein
MPRMSASFLRSPRALGRARSRCGRWRATRKTPTGALTYAEDDSSSIVQTPFKFSDILNVFTGDA